MTVAIHVKKILAEEIERSGGLRQYFNSDKSNQSLSRFLDQDINNFGSRGTKKRRAVRDLLKSWKSFSRNKYETLLQSYKVLPYSHRYRDIPADNSDNEENEEEDSSASETEVRFEKLVYFFLLRECQTDFHFSTCRSCQFELLVVEYHFTRKHRRQPHHHTRKHHRQPLEVLQLPKKLSRQRKLPKQEKILNLFPRFKK